MKKIRKLLALTLVFCMMTALGVWNTSAQADWYTVTFNQVDNRKFEGVPTGVTPTAAAASQKTVIGSSSNLTNVGQIEYYYNAGAETLIISGWGEMPGFDKEHPAPWFREARWAKRVIIDERVLTISNEAFKDFEYLRSVVFPSTLKKIAANSFENCEKLKRIEVVINVDDAKTLVRESESKELEKAEIVRVTRDAVLKEIEWLTTYWVGDWEEITYDKAGRPIRIIEHLADGRTIDTRIKYLNPATAANQAKNANTAERYYSVKTTKSGDKTAAELEKTEYGQNLVKGGYELNKDGRQVKGVEITQNGTDSNKRVLYKAKYNADGSGTKEWVETELEKGTLNAITEYTTETVDKNDKVKSAETLYLDANGVLRGYAKTENDYNKDGNKTKTDYYQVDEAGAKTAEGSTSYDYDPATKRLTGKTDTYTEYPAQNKSKKTETTSEYGYDSKGNVSTVKETVTNTEKNGSTTTTKTTETTTSYQYTDKGLKKASTEKVTYVESGNTKETTTTYDKNERPVKEESTTKNSAGDILQTVTNEISYNSDHVISKSVKTIEDASGTHTVTTNYDKDGWPVKETTEEKDEDGNPTGSITNSYTYNEDGMLTSSTQVVKDDQGNTKKTIKEETKYDSLGRVLKYTQTTTEGDKTKSTSTTKSYDSDGRIITEDYETLENETKTGSKATYTYNKDGSYTKKITDLEETATQTSEYDDTGRITKETLVEKDADGNKTGTETTYTYDEDGTPHTETRNLTEEELSNLKSAPKMMLMSFRAASDEACEGICEETCGETCEETCEKPDYELTGTEEATCEEPAYEIYRCKGCGYEFKKEVGEPLGHDYELKETIAATETDPAYEIYICKRCKDEISKPVTEEDNEDAAEQKDQVSADSGKKEDTPADTGKKAGETPTGTETKDAQATDIDKTDLPAADTGKTDVPAADIGKTDLPAADIGNKAAPVADPAKTDIPAADPAKTDVPAADTGNKAAPAADTGNKAAPADPKPANQIPVVPTPQNTTPVPSVAPVQTASENSVPENTEEG